MFSVIGWPTIVRESKAYSFNRFVCAATANPINTVLIRNYKTARIGHIDHDCTLTEALRATTAAPLYFEPITFKSSGVTFVDGGIRVNNPIDEVKNEAVNLWPDRAIGCLVSIGTGVTLPPGLDTKGNARLHQILKSLAHIATDANNKAREFVQRDDGKKLRNGGKYYRYSVPQGMDEVQLKNFEEFPYLEAATLPYVQDMDYIIEQCAAALANPTPLCT